MKKLIFAVVALFMFAFGANAQLLWKVSGKGDKTSYLFGTHHVAPADFLGKQTALNEALKNADAVYGEVVLSDMETPETQQMMMGYLQAPADSTLSKVFSAEEIAKLNAFMQKYMGPMAGTAQMEGFKPAFLSTTLAMVFGQLAFPDFNPADQLDTKIQKLAIADGKPVKGLETVKDQLDVLFNNSIASQAKDVIKMIDEENEQVSKAHALAAAYISENLDDILKCMSEIDDPAEMDRLINNRNVKWAEELDEIIPSQNIVVAVGAGHLSGEKGLINLLRKKGFTVEPVK